MHTRRDNLVAQLRTWTDISIQPHRFGGIQFAYKGKEIGHMHGDHLVDIPLSKSKRDEAIAAGLAQPHHIFPHSNWVSVYLNVEQDLSHAIELLRWKYEQLKKGKRSSD